MPSLTHNDSNVLHRLSQRVPHLRAALADPDQALLNLQMDSIDLVELLCAIESEFGVRLSDEDLQNAVTIGKLAEMISDRGQSRRIQS